MQIVFRGVKAQCNVGNMPRLGRLAILPSVSATQVRMNLVRLTVRLCAIQRSSSSRQTPEPESFAGSGLPRERRRPVPRVVTRAPSAPPSAGPWGFLLGDFPKLGVPFKGGYWGYMGISRGIKGLGRRVWGFPLPFWGSPY